MKKKIFDGCHKKKRLIWWAYFKSSTYHAHAFSQERCLAIKRIIQSFSVDCYIMYSRHFFEDLTVDEAEHSKTPTTPVGLVLDSGAAEAMKIRLERTVFKIYSFSSHRFHYSWSAVKTSRKKFLTRYWFAE